MPAHNAGRWLPEAIESLLAQSLPDFELLVVDDGSTDDSPTLLSDLARRDGRIRVLQQSKSGLCQALNRGLAAARAPLFARLDADDLADPDRLQRQVGYLRRTPTVGMVGSWAREINGQGRPLGQRTPETEPEALKRELARGNPFVHSSIMARTQLMRDLGGYRAAFQAAEDYDLWLRMSEVSDLANLPQMLVSYRVHSDSVTGRDAMRQAFSVRLAKSAATARRNSGADPSEALSEPPDWRCALAMDAFYARDAALYRWLDHAGWPALPEDRVAPSPCAALFDQLDGLSHAERRLAAWALMAQLRSADQLEAREASSLLLRLCRERPATVLSAAWSLRRGPAGKDRTADQ